MLLDFSDFSNLRGACLNTIGRSIDALRSPDSFSLSVFTAFVTLIGSAAQAQDRDPMLIHDANGTKVRAHLQFGLNAVVERNLYWDLAATTAPASGFDPDTEWLEAYIKPGLSFEKSLDTGAILYGKISAVASYTAGTDAFDRGDTGATTLEEAYLAIRGDTGAGLSYDLSLGARELKLGTGMLIASGGTSGFERGALKLGPRKAWEMAAIGKLLFGDYTGTVFYIDPNELPSSDGGNELAGLDIRYDGAEGGYAGFTYVKVLESGSPYPQAGVPPILPGARDGLNAFSLYGRTNSFEGSLENWTFAGDLAYEWNDEIDLEAWAGRVQATYAFANVAWSPTLTLGYQTFSGDDPSTSKLERFDPLYYEGSPSSWATGSKSASTFINSNVNGLSLALRVKPTQQDTLTLRYAHIRANELNSPIQFGQATRLDATGNIVTGVTDAHLSDDVFLEYSRVINRNTYLTAGVSAAFPGAGIKDVVGADAPTWTGGFINVVINF